MTTRDDDTFDLVLYPNADINYLELAFNDAVEFVRYRTGKIWHGDDRDRYDGVIRNDRVFHDFETREHGILFINYEDDLDINSGNFDRELIAVIRQSIQKFGSKDEFNEAYEKFEKNHDTEDVLELNRRFKIQ